MAERDKFNGCVNRFLGTLLVAATLAGVAIWAGPKFPKPRGTNPQPPTEPYRPNQGISSGPGINLGGSHVVQPGDTIYKIAGRYGVSPTDLMRANPRPDPNLIYPYETFIIPGTTTTTSSNPVSAAVFSGQHCATIPPGGTVFSAMKYARLPFDSTPTIVSNPSGDIVYSGPASRLAQPGFSVIVQANGTACQP